MATPADDGKDGGLHKFMGGGRNKIEFPNMCVDPGPVCIEDEEVLSCEPGDTPLETTEFLCEEIPTPEETMSVVPPALQHLLLEETELPPVLPDLIVRRDRLTARLEKLQARTHAPFRIFLDRFALSFNETWIAVHNSQSDTASLEQAMREIGLLEQYAKFLEDRESLFLNLPSRLHEDPTFQQIKKTNRPLATRIEAAYDALFGRHDGFQEVDALPTSDAQNYDDFAREVMTLSLRVQSPAIVEFQEKIGKRETAKVTASAEYQERIELLKSAARLQGMALLARRFRHPEYRGAFSIDDLQAGFMFDNEGPITMTTHELRNIRALVNASAQQLERHAKTLLTATQSQAWLQKLQQAAGRFDFVARKLLEQHEAEEQPVIVLETVDLEDFGDATATLALYERTLLAEELQKRVDDLRPLARSPEDQQKISAVTSDVDTFHFSIAITALPRRIHDLLTKVDNTALRFSIQHEINTFTDKNLRAQLARTFEDAGGKRDRSAVPLVRYDAAVTRLRQYLTMMDHDDVDTARQLYAHWLEHPGHEELLQFITRAGHHAVAETLGSFALQVLIVVAAFGVGELVAAATVPRFAAALSMRGATLRTALQATSFSELAGYYLVFGTTADASMKALEYALMGSTPMRGLGDEQIAKSFLLDIGFVSAMLPYLRAVGIVPQHLLRGIAESPFGGMSAAEITQRMARDPLFHAHATAYLHNARMVIAYLQPTLHEAAELSRIGQLDVIIRGAASLANLVVFLTPYEVAEGSTKQKVLTGRAHFSETFAHALTAESTIHRIAFLASVGLAHHLVAPLTHLAIEQARHRADRKQREKIPDDRERLAKIPDEVARLQQQHVQGKIDAMRLLSRLIALQREKTRLLERCSENNPDDMAREHAVEKIYEALLQRLETLEANRDLSLDALESQHAPVPITIIKNRTVSVSVVHDASRPSPTYVVHVFVDGKDFGSVRVEPGSQGRAARIVEDSEIIGDHDDVGVSAEEVSLAVHQWVDESREEQAQGTRRLRGDVRISDVTDDGAWHAITVGSSDNLSVRVTNGDGSGRYRVDVRRGRRAIGHLRVTQNGSRLSYAIDSMDLPEDARPPVERWISAQAESGVAGSGRRRTPPRPTWVTPDSRRTTFQNTDVAFDAVARSETSTSIAESNGHTLSIRAQSPEGMEGIGATIFEVTLILDGRDVGGAVVIIEADGSVAVREGEPPSVHSFEGLNSDQRRRTRNWITRSLHDWVDARNNQHQPPSSGSQPLAASAALPTRPFNVAEVSGKETLRGTAHIVAMGPCTITAFLETSSDKIVLRENGGEIGSARVTTRGDKIISVSDIDFRSGQPRLTSRQEVERVLREWVKEWNYEHEEHRFGRRASRIAERWLASALALVQSAFSPSPPVAAAPATGTTTSRVWRLIQASVTNPFLMEIMQSLRASREEVTDAEFPSFLVNTYNSLTLLMTFHAGDPIMSARTHRAMRQWILLYDAAVRDSFVLPRIEGLEAHRKNLGLDAAASIPVEHLVPRTTVEGVAEESTRTLHLLATSGETSEDIIIGECPLVELHNGRQLNKQPDVTSVSLDRNAAWKFHARLYNIDHQWRIDGYGNIQINGQRIVDHQVLRDGDRLRIDDAEFVVRIPPSPRVASGGTSGGGGSGSSSGGRRRSPVRRHQPPRPHAHRRHLPHGTRRRPVEVSAQEVFADGTIVPGKPQGISAAGEGGKTGDPPPPPAAAISDGPVIAEVAHLAGDRTPPPEDPAWQATKRRLMRELYELRPEKVERYGLGPTFDPDATVSDRHLALTLADHLAHEGWRAHIRATNYERREPDWRGLYNTPAEDSGPPTTFGPRQYQRAIALREAIEEAKRHGIDVVGSPESYDPTIEGDDNIRNAKESLGNAWAWLLSALDACPPGWTPEGQTPPPQAAAGLAAVAPPAAAEPSDLAELKQRILRGVLMDVPMPAKARAVLFSTSEHDPRMNWIVFLRNLMGDLADNIRYEFGGVSDSYPSAASDAQIDLDVIPADFCVRASAIRRAIEETEAAGMAVITDLSRLDHQLLLAAEWHPLPPRETGRSLEPRRRIAELRTAYGDDSRLDINIFSSAEMIDLFAELTTELITAFRANWNGPGQRQRLVLDQLPEGTVARARALQMSVNNAARGGLHLLRELPEIRRNYYDLLNALSLIDTGSGRF